MKKTILISALAVLGFASCKKDRTCTCTSSIVSVTSTDPNFVYTPSTTTPLPSSTKYTKIKKNGVIAQQCVTRESTSQQYSGNSAQYIQTTVTKSDCKLK